MEKDSIDVLEEISDDISDLNKKTEDPEKNKFINKQKIRDFSDIDINKNLTKMTSKQNSIFTKLGDTFSDKFGGLVESLKPSNMVGLLGAEMNSPLIGMMTDKMSSVEDFVSGSMKNAFMKEEQEEKKYEEAKKTNDLLEQIAGNTDNIEPEKKKFKFMDFLTNPGETIKKIMIGVVSGLAAFMTSPGRTLKNIIGGITGGLFKGAKGKSGGIISKLFRGLGKMALPVAILFGAKDFIKGMRSVEEIAGTDNIIDAVMVGVSEVISQLTFGLFSTKNIYSVLDFVRDQFVKILRAPFVIINEMMTTDEPILDIVKRNVFKMLSGISFGVLSEENIENAFKFVVDKVKYMLEHPIKSIENIINAYMDFLEVDHFDITGTVDTFVDKISNYFDNIIKSITDFKDLIFETLEDKFKDAAEFLSFGLYQRDIPEFGRLPEVSNNIPESRLPEITTNRESNIIAEQYRRDSDYRERMKRKKDQDMKDMNTITNVVTSNTYKDSDSTSVDLSSPRLSMF